jgi:hypothetical protein
MTGKGIGQEGSMNFHGWFFLKKLLLVNVINPLRLSEFYSSPLDLFPNKPIIGRNTLNKNEPTLEPLPYCRPYCGPYY